MSFLSLNQSPHPLSDRSGDISSGAELVMLSAASEGALTALVAQLYGYLQTRPEVSLADVAHSFSQATAVAKEHRLSIVADSRERLLACLQAATAGRLEKGVLRSQAPGTAPPGSGVVFIFPGQGSQWLGMGRQLLRQEAVFAQALQACDRAILAESGWSVLEELAASEAVSRIERVDVTQPLIFSIAVALSALWKSWGVVPSCVVGHSLGEVAAAYVAGSLSMAEAAAVICRCSRMMHRISGQGAMAVVELGYQKTEEALRGCAGRVNLALSNSPKSTVISGEKEAMAELLIKLEAQGIFCRRIKTDVAGHTPQLDKVREQMLELLGELHSRKPAVPMFSTVTAKEVGEGELTGHYFFDTVRKPIRFSQVIGLLAERGYEIFVEISPHPLLTTSVQETLEATGKSALTIGSLRRGQPERELLLQGLGALWGRGLPVTPSAFFKAGGALAQIRTELLDLAGKAESESAEKESLLHMGWEAAPHPSGAGKVDPGRWLILGDGAGLGAALRAALSSAGHRAVLAVARTRKPQKDAWVVDDTSAVRLRALLGEAFSGQAPTGIIHLRCLDGQELGEESFEEELEGILERSGDALLALLQALSEKKPRLYLVTRGAQALGDADVSIAAAPLVGLGRVLGREHPEWRSTLVDLDPAAPGDETGPLLSELQSGSEEEEVAFRAGVRYVGRLSRGLGAAPSQKPALAIRSDGTYLIVGGLGRLGLTVAGFLAIWSWLL